MNLIHQNPFRVIGVLADASDKEILKQRNKINAFAKVGREISSEYDFSFLQRIERNSESINKAFADIQRNEDKIIHALFWFSETNSIDKTILDYIKLGGNENITNAINIMNKMIVNKSVSKVNISSFNNLSTIYLISTKKEINRIGVETKLKLIESDYFLEYSKAIVDNTYSIEQNHILEKICEAIINGYKKKWTPEELFSLFENCSPMAKKHITDVISSEPFTKIKKLISQSEKQRKETPSEAFNIGEKLYSKVESDLSFLKSIISTKFQYKDVADKTASELLQCGLDYFNFHQDKDVKFDSTTMILFQKAKSIALSHSLQTKIQENIDGLQEWIDNEPQIKEQQKFEELIKIIEHFTKQSKSVHNAKLLLNQTEPFLTKFKSQLSITDEIYLKLSTRIAFDAQQMCVTEINYLQEQYKYAFSFGGEYYKIDQKYKLRANKIFEKAGVKGGTSFSGERLLISEDLNDAIKLALKISDRILTMDLEKNFRVNVKENKKALLKLKEELKPKKVSKSDDNIGCIIFIILLLIIAIIGMTTS